MYVLNAQNTSKHLREYIALIHLQQRLRQAIGLKRTTKRNGCDNSGISGVYFCVWWWNA